MPYIEEDKRFVVEESWSPQTPGELNYLITKLVDQYLQNTINYTEINAAIGVLECAKLELYRRVAAPYENQKCYVNGDVYTSCIEEGKY